jgi:hypothetical protein
MSCLCLDRDAWVAAMLTPPLVSDRVLPRLTNATKQLGTQARLLVSGTMLIILWCVGDIPDGRCGGAVDREDHADSPR